MIEIDRAVRDRVKGQYEKFCSDVGTKKHSVLLRSLRKELPYPVEVTERPADEIHQCTVTGQAFTDEKRRQHHVSIASELRGVARTHTLAHELYHLRFHRLDQADVEEMLDYYLTLPELARMPRAIARTALRDALASPRHRDGRASLWEQEAECFALLVVSNSPLITRPMPRSTLMAALGDIHAS